ncbi:hypothetical protein [Ruminococcus callidus]|nr:hypothetical protein [Ruminococcus callidus]
MRLEKPLRSHQKNDEDQRCPLAVPECCCMLPSQPIESEDT